MASMDDKGGDRFSDGDVVRLARLAVKQEIERNRALGLPIVTSDHNTGRIYKQFSDGTRTEIPREYRGPFSR